jgi:hypothetical protein
MGNVPDGRYLKLTSIECDPLQLYGIQPTSGVISTRHVRPGLQYLPLEGMGNSKGPMVLCLSRIIGEERLRSGAHSWRRNSTTAMSTVYEG